MSQAPSAQAIPAPGSWLNRNVLGAGLTSFLADAGYETASAALPAFLASLGGPVKPGSFGPAALWLGIIEGVSDGISSSVKLVAAWWSDRVGHRKAIVTLGYALSGCGGAFFAAALAWPVILLGRAIAWFGRGIRGPLRDAILAESVAPADRGKVFGFHRAGDTLGAIVGPLLGALLLALLPHRDDDVTTNMRALFLLTLIPGAGSALTFALMIREQRRTPDRTRRLWASIKTLPAPFQRFLVGVGVFGAGDFAATLLILAATEMLRPEYGHDAASLSVLLYALRNGTYAGASFPIGWLSDRIGRRLLLALGYVLGGGVMIGFAIAFAASFANLGLLVVLFALAGVSIAAVDALEGALAADLIPDAALRGTAYGVMGTVNGVGDLVSSVMVGTLWWAVGPVPGFAIAAVLMVLGAGLLELVR